MAAERERTIRRPLYQGSQVVHALWFDCGLLGEDEARRRVLADWDGGARAWRVGGGYLLAWRQGRRLQCERAPGLPLCEQDGVLASAPLLAHERAGIAAGGAAPGQAPARLPAPSMVLVHGAGIRRHALVPELRVDPSQWLDVSGLPLHAALAMPAAARHGFTPAVPEAAPDLRSLLGDAAPKASPQRAAFLRHAAATHAVHRAGGQDAPVHAGGGWAGTIAVGLLGAAGLAGAGLGGIIAGLVGLFGGPGSADAPGGAGRQAPSPWRARLQRSLSGLAVLSRISKLLGWRQARYLHDMLQRFESGDLDEALRRAIPLDDPNPSNHAALDVPQRRDGLEIGGARGGRAIGLGHEAAALLRATYRRSFEALDRAGRVDEAVFVLAELLHRHQEAVDYLEGKGRILQAARLAETLALAPSVVVRLYAMAGDLERAVRLARLTQSFDAAVAELERRKHPGAAALRLEWAQALAARGDLIEATVAVWPLEDQRGHARVWLAAAEQAGDDLGVQGLLYRLALDPQAAHERSAAVDALLYGQDQDDDGARLRLRAGECLLRLDGHNALTRRLAAELWRRLLADRMAGRPGASNEQCKKLLALAQDPVLAADAPTAALPPAAALPAAVALQGRAGPLEVAFDERGLLPLHDVRRLPDGGYLLALGEAGVALARADGGEKVRFPVPAHHLVLAANGRQALALAAREKSTRVSRVDLLRRTTDDWFSAPLDLWAREYDGASWTVVADARLMALDAGAAGQSVLWQVRDLPGRIVGFDQRGGMQAMLLEVGDRVEQWRYALPDRRLVQRDHFEVDAYAGALVVLPDSGAPAPLMLELLLDDAADQAGKLRVLPNQHANGSAIPLAWEGPPPRPSLHGVLLMLQYQLNGAWQCQLFDLDCRLLAHVALPDAQQASATVQDGCLLAWDRRGRLVEIEIATSRVRTLTLG